LAIGRAKADVSELRSRRVRYYLDVTDPVLEVATNPRLQVPPATTLYSGTVRLGGADTISRAGQPPKEYGFFVPDAPPWDRTTEPPQAWAEAHLMLLRMVDTRFEMGVERATAGYLADPRGGTARWLHCSVLAHAPFPIRIGYRVTVNAASAVPSGPPGES
jgi:hypothetical protein